MEGLRAIYFASAVSLGYKTPLPGMRSLGEELTPGAVAWVCVGVHSIIYGINDVLDLVGITEDAK